MITLDQLRTDAEARKTQLTQLVSAPNPPQWVSFTPTGTGFQVMLNPPLNNTGNAYLAAGTGLDFPTTDANNTNYAPIFYYQVQTASDAAFTQNVQTFDMGTSSSYSVTQVSGAAYAQARARFVNSSFSQWQPFGNQVSGATFRPFEFTTVNGAVTNPYLAMDGDTTTAAVISPNVNGVLTSLTVGPFNNVATLTNGLTLSVISSATGNGDQTVSYSVDAGQSFTTIRTRGSNPPWSKTTDTVTLPNNFNLGLLRVQASDSFNPTSISLYEAFVQ